MKKILFIANSMKMGGVEKSLLRLLNAINKNEYLITLMLIKKAGELCDEIPEEINVIEMPFFEERDREDILSSISNGKLNQLLKIIDIKCFNKKLHICSDGIKKTLEKTIKLDEEYDLAIDFHGYGHFGIPYLIEKVQAKTKGVFIHDENISGFYDVYAYMKKADVLFAVSDACKNIFIKEYPEFAPKVEKFENIFDVEEIRRLSKQETNIKIENKKECIVFVSVGRLEEQKGIDRGIETFKLLYDEGFDFKWYIIGDGSQRKKLEKMIWEYGLYENILLLGSIRNPFSLVVQADIFLQISRHEGKPLAVFEAQALGIPVFATKYSAVDEQITDGENGYIVGNSIDEIYHGLKNVLLDKNTVEKYKKNLEMFQISNEGSLDKIYSYASRSV